MTRGDLGVGVDRIAGNLRAEIPRQVSSNLRCHFRLASAPAGRRAASPSSRSCISLLLVDQSTTSSRLRSRMASVRN